MSIGQETKDRIQQFAGKQTVGGYIDSLVSVGQSQQEAFESPTPSNEEAAFLLYSGLITIGIAAGALTGYVSSGGRRCFSSGGWTDTLIGTVAGLMIGIGLGQLGNALFNVIKKG